MNVIMWRPRPFAVFDQADQRWLSMPVDQVTLACPKCGHEQRANTWKWTRATVDVPRAVVSGIILITITDGIFSVVYYYLGV